MALRNILVNGDETLNKKCRPVVDFNSVKPTEPSEKEEQDNVVEF